MILSHGPTPRYFTLSPALQIYNDMPTEQNEQASIERVQILAYVENLIEQVIN